MSQIDAEVALPHNGPAAREGRRFAHEFSELIAETRNQRELLLSVEI
jgi:hypothetical protein